MYQLISAKVKPVGRNGFWVDENISTKIIGQLFVDYKKAWFILTNPALDKTKYLDMELMKSLEFLDESLTLTEWFAAIGNLALPTTDIEPDFSPQLVRFGDAWKANYDISTVSNVYNPLVEVPKSEQVDLLLQRAGTDYTLMGSRVLASVNGLLHLTESSEYGFHIRQGGKSGTYCNKTQVGLLSFNALGDVNLVPINRTMLAQPHPSVKLKEKVYIDTGVDLSNKSVLISIGGYLHSLSTNSGMSGIYTPNGGPFNAYRVANVKTLNSLLIPKATPIKTGQFVIGVGIPKYARIESWEISGPYIISITLNLPAESTGNGNITLVSDSTIESDFDIVGKQTIRINWDRIPYAKRYFEQRRLMDMSPLGLSTNVNNPAQISVEEFYSDETIKRYLELSQSFLIIIDNPELFTEYQIVESGKLPGVYYSYVDTFPTYPMQIGLGRIGNYWKFFDDGKWVLSVDEAYYNYYNFETTSYLQENSIDDTRRTEKPAEYADGFFMMIGVP